MEKIINLPTRDGFKNILSKLTSTSHKESSTYLLKAEIPFMYVEEVNNKILSIDPRGGPRIAVGESIKGLNQLGSVKMIEHLMNKGFIITFDK